MKLGNLGRGLSFLPSILLWLVAVVLLISGGILIVLTSLASSSTETTDLGTKAFSAGWLLIGAGALALTLDAGLRRAWPEIGIATLILFAVGLLAWPWPLTPADHSSVGVEFQLSAADLTSGTTLFDINEYRGRPNKYVKLIIVREAGEGETKTIETTPYHNLQVLDFLDVNGRSVRNTGEKPDSILLSIASEDDLDAMVKGLQDNKRAAYLLPQGTDIVTPTDAPTPTPTPAPTTSDGSVAFSLPKDKIRSDLSNLELGGKVVVIMVVEGKDRDGNVVTHEGHPYEDDVTLLDLLNKEGKRLKPPYDEANTVRVSLPISAEELSAVQFAADLADASAIYLLRK